MQTKSTGPHQRFTNRSKISVLLLILAFATLFLSPEISWATAGQQIPFQYPATVRVGSGSDPQVVVVDVESAGSVGGLATLSKGTAGGDFTATSSVDCGVGVTLHIGDSCHVTVQFRPEAPGVRLGAVLIRDTNGSILGKTLLYAVGTGPIGVFLPATINTVAGNGAWVYRGDGGYAIASPIFLPGGIAVDGAGNLFISDSSNNRIRRVDAVSGTIVTVAGTGSAGFDGANGPATAASVNAPTGMVIDGAGDIIFADSGNHAIRKLTIATGVLSTIAGQLGTQGYAGDGLPARSGLLNTPESVAFNAHGDLFISDTGNHAIRKLDGSTGILTTIAGTGQAGFSGDGGRGISATLNTPWGIAMDVNGNLYVADLSNQRIRKVTPSGLISTVVGTGTGTYNGDGGPATSANVKDPAAVAVDVAGNLYVADSGNNMVRKVSSATGLISTVVGTGDPAFGGDLKPATQAGIYGPYALTLDSQGNLYLSDIFHHRIREVLNNQATLSYPPMRVGRTSAPQLQSFENDGNGLLNLSAITADNNAIADPGTTTCSAQTSLGVNASCLVGAEFFPQVTGTPVSSVIQLGSDAANSASAVSLSGEVDALEPTRTVVTSSANPAALGTVVTFTAVVTGAGVAPSGNVRFFDGGALLGTSPIASSSTATFATANLALGSHTITAAFTGDPTNSPSASAALPQIIKQAAVVAISSSRNNSQVGVPITFTANVSSGSMQPTGAVTFLDGSAVLGAGALDSNGIAHLVLSSLSAGTHNVTANYAGDTNTLPASSTPLGESIDRWATNVVLTSNSSTVAVGSRAVFSLSVISTSNANATGSVAIKDGAVVIVTLSLNSSGHATYTTSSLAVGVHTLVAGYSGDASNGTSESSPLDQTVQQIATATIMSASINPAIAGTALHLSATVSASSAANGAALSGDVTFMEGATMLGSATLSSAGIAAIDLNNLAVGRHTIVAHYMGCPDFAVSTSNALVEAVQLAGTTVQLNSSMPNPVSGSTVTFTAIVSGTGGIPSGVVTFLDGTVTLGSAAVNASGQANLRIATLAAGLHQITASYNGDANDEASLSVPMTQAVEQAATAIILTSSSNPSIAAVPVTVLASLTSNGSLPSGVITLRDGANILSTGTISPTGACSFNIATLLAGTHNLAATFAGDPDHAASTTVLTQTVQQGSSSINLGSNGTPSLYGDSVVFSARVVGSGNQPQGQIVFAEGTTQLGVVSVDPAGNGSLQRSDLALGDHTITVTYAGDASHTAATSASFVQRVQENTSTALVSSVNPSLVGATVQLVATVKGSNQANVTGTVRFTDGATILGSPSLDGTGMASLRVTALTAGSHLIVATYLGDPINRASVSAGYQQAVNTAGTSVRLVVDRNPTVVGQAVTLTATVESMGNAPTGTVIFLEGAITLGTAQTSGGVAHLTIGSLTAGQHAIVARYGGDGGTEVSTSSALSLLTQQSTSITLVSDTNPAPTAQQVTLTATIRNGSNPGGIVSFQDGSVQLGSVAVDGTAAAVLKIPSLSSGTHSLTAAYLGDSLNLPSSSAALQESVERRPTTTALTASSNAFLSGGTVTLVAVVHFTGPLSPTGTVTFASSASPLGSAPVSASGAATLTFFPVANAYDISATYIGDGVYSGSISDTFKIQSGPITTFTMSANAASLSLQSGSHSTIDLTMSSVKGFTDILALGCLELPLDTTCTFSDDRPTLLSDGSKTVHLTIDTGNPLGSGAQASVTKFSRGITGTGVILPAGLLLGTLLAFTRKSRRIPALLCLFLFLVSSMGLTGCGTNLRVDSTPAGSYTIRIIASGTQSGASQVIDLPLKVAR